MKNKILAISIIFILLSFLFINNSVFATETTNTLIVDGHDMSDIYNYFSTDDAFFIFKVSGSDAYHFYKPSSNYITYINYTALHSETKDSTIRYYNSSWECAPKWDFYSYDITTGKFKFGWHGDIDGSWNKSNMIILYSSKGIYNADHTTFFMNPPAPPAPTTLAGVLEATNPTQVWKEQMKNVVVSLAVFLVGLVAFLKAWAWLKTQLRKA